MTNEPPDGDTSLHVRVHVRASSRRVRLGLGVTFDAVRSASPCLASAWLLDGDSHVQVATTKPCPWVRVTVKVEGEG